MLRTELLHRGDDPVENDVVFEVGDLVCVNADKAEIGMVTAVHPSFNPSYEMVNVVTAGGVNVRLYLEKGQKISRMQAQNILGALRRNLAAVQERISGTEAILSEFDEKALPGPVKG